MPLLDQVQGKVKDTGGMLTDPDDYTAAIVAALARYSKHNPKASVADLAGDDSHDLDLPGDWVDELSSITQVEYPVGDIPATLLDADKWTLYQSPTGIKLRLFYDTPDTGDSVRVTYTVARLEADVPDEDLDAVACLAAATCLQQLASLFLQTSDPIIRADVVNYRSKSAEARAAAKDLRKQYSDHVGTDEDGGPPAASVMATPPPDGRTRLTH
ncbi:MAG: hypothetical protein KAT93_06720 [Desulfuromonadales bacterium]|nr:hypothetical protein [Desulfuromonadales bacterium]